MVGHFEPLVRKWGIKIWHDREIKPGEKWDDSIKKEIREAEIVIPLISGDFFSSKYIHEVEMQEALRRHSNNECIVVPVIARACAWSADPSLRTIQVLPTDGKAVGSWTSKDEAWENVVSSVERILQTIKVDRAQKAQVETLEERVEKLKSENERLKEELEKTAEQRERFGELESKLEDTKTSSQSLIVSLKEKVEVLEAENKKLRESLQKSEERERRYTHLELKWDGIEQENRNLAARINQLEAENNTILREKEEFKKAKHQKDKDYADLTEKQKVELSEKLKLAARIKQLEIENSAILREKEDLKKEKQKDKGYADLAEKQQTELSEKLKAATYENNKLKKEIANIKAQIAKFQESSQGQMPRPVWLVLFLGIIGLPFSLIYLLSSYVLESYFDADFKPGIIISVGISSIGVIALNYYLYTSDSYWLRYTIISTVSFTLGITLFVLLIIDSYERDKEMNTLPK
jgi:cell division protein FtsB